MPKGVRRNRKTDCHSVKSMVYGRYKWDANKRGYEFNISFDKFVEISQCNCYYCGRPPHETVTLKNMIGSFTYNGMDRKDNSVGYTEENVVPCCRTCNWAKKAKREEDFLEWIKLVYENRFVNHASVSPHASNMLKG